MSIIPLPTFALPPLPSIQVGPFTFTLPVIVPLSL